MASRNTAAWLQARHRDLVVDAAPYPTPGVGEIVVRNRALAVNPVDWIIQSTGRLVYPWLKGPVVLGSDVAGDVAEIGAGVSRFAVGDRVVGHAMGSDRGHDHRAEGAFQLFTVLRENVMSPIPDELSFTRAAVLPLGLSTAACALFQTQQLGLTYPSANAPATGSTVLVWGGATSVGSNAIQLAHAAGYDVITTCSPHNAEAMRRLGALEVCDYRSPTVVDDLVAVLAGRTLAGALALGNGSTRPCIDVVSRCEGRRFVAQASTPVSFAGLRDNPRRTPGVMLRVASGSTRSLLAARRGQVQTKFISGSSLANDEVSHLVYRDFLAAALADGRYQTAPEPNIIGTGLHCLQAALDRQRAGVSAEKIVVALPAGND
jgi:NADPH:quinone reductase-like Zn-dependent oxidoreductase